MEDSNQLTPSPDEDQLAELWSKCHDPHLSDSIVRQTIDSELSFQTTMMDTFHNNDNIVAQKAVKYIAMYVIFFHIEAQ